LAGNGAIVKKNDISRITPKFLDLTTEVSFVGGQVWRIK
jgi:hypothetical protein